MKQKQLDYLKGLSAETFAASYLRLKGFKILERRLKTQFGEIDIIAQKNNLIIFCEIKYRKTLSDAAYSISSNQQTRIINASQYWMQQKQIPNTTDVRIDAILFYKYGFKHYENAWQDCS